MQAEVALGHSHRQLSAFFVSRRSRALAVDPGVLCRLEGNASTPRIVANKAAFFLSHGQLVFAQRF